MSTETGQSVVKSIQGEIAALQEERVAHETAMQSRSRERGVDAEKLKTDWHGGLRDIDVRIRNAISRLSIAQADETRAAAAGVRNSPVQEPTADPVAEKHD